MSRIRTIKPEFWKHEALSELSVEAHMLAAALLNYADDEGCFNANPKLVQAECCPLRKVNIEKCLNDLKQIGYVRFGKGEDGRSYGHIVNFLSHQVINRATPSNISTLNIVWDRSVNTHGALTEHSLLEGKGRERKGTGNGKEGNVATRLHPSWKPSSSDLEYGENLGLSPREIEDCAEGMRLWGASAAGANAAKRDWSAAFKGWMRREVKADDRKYQSSKSKTTIAAERVREKIERMKNGNGGYGVCVQHSPVLIGKSPSSSARPGDPSGADDDIVHRETEGTSQAHGSPGNGAFKAGGLRPIGESVLRLVGKPDTCEADADAVEARAAGAGDKG